jgi:hypothetical protein
MLSSHALRGRIPTPVLPGTLSSGRPRRGIRGRQQVRRPSQCPERGTRMEPWVAPRGVPTPIASLPAPRAACRSPINALIQTDLAPAHPGAFLSRTASAVAGGLTTSRRLPAAYTNKMIRSNPPSGRLETKVPTKWFRPGQEPHVGRSNLMSTAPRPIPGRPDETPRPGPAGPRTPYPVNDPGFADPNKPGSEPDYIPPPSPAGTPEI